MKSLVLFLFIVSILIFSCESTGPSKPDLKRQLVKVELENLKGIPAEYGKLISVTAHAQYEGWSQLWFVDAEDTIRMVRIQFHENQVHDQVLVIPRY